MADTITIAGKPISKNVLYIGGAAVAGVVGYAWWQNGIAGSDVPTEEIPEPVAEPTDEPGFSVSGGLSGTDIRTNADWSELAIARLIAIGIDAPAVSSAIGKFLQRKPLTAIEADLVRQAVRAAGNPPVDGPWLIVEATPGQVVIPPPTGRPGAIASVNAVGGKARWSATWTVVPGAISYEYRGIQGYPAGTGHPWKNVGNRLSASGIIRPTYPQTWSIEVRARNAAGVGPAKRSGPIRILP